MYDGVSIRGMGRNVPTFVLSAVACAVLTTTLAAGQSEPGEIVGHKLPVPGEPVHGTTDQLSEVEREMIERLDPQQQAERLLQYAISHHRERRMRSKRGRSDGAVK
jgi:hypothetical protein